MPIIYTFNLRAPSFFIQSKAFINVLNMTSFNLEKRYFEYSIPKGVITINGINRWLKIQYIIGNLR